MKQGFEMLSSAIASHWDVPTETSNSQEQKSPYQVMQRMTIRQSSVNKSCIPTGDWKYGRYQVKTGLEVDSLNGYSERLSHQNCDLVFMYWLIHKPNSNNLPRWHLTLMKNVTYFKRDLNSWALNGYKCSSSWAQMDERPMHFLP